MEIIITDRKTVSNMEFIVPTAVISITDMDYFFADLKNSPKFLLQMQFDDIDGYVFEDEGYKNPTYEQRLWVEKKYNIISDEQAQKIASFYFKAKPLVTRVICQCEHGQSRSAAVAAAILEYEQKEGINIFANEKYSPNKIIFHKVLTALKEGK